MQLKFYYQLGTMNYKKYIFNILIIFFSFPFFLYADRITSALKYLKKGEFKKAKKQLEKQLEKDSLHAGAFHVLSLYYFNEKNSSFKVDSAYFFIQKSIKNYPKVNPKDLKEWKEENISIETAQKLKTDIEIFAFQQAKKENTIEQYECFLKIYKNAPQRTEAENLRNIIIWQKTLEKNNLESYEKFLEEYPNALQTKNAIQKRDSLQWVNFVPTKTISNIQNFLTNYPKNQYAFMAWKVMYDLLSLKHTPETYQYFIQKYPKAEEKKLAEDWLASFYYHQKNAPIQEGYWIDLKKQQDLQLVPFLEDEGYGFMNETGEILVANYLDEIPKKYHCESIKTDYILTYKNGYFGIMDKFGRLWYDTQFDKIEPIGENLLRVSKNSTMGIIHALTGREILPLKYDMIEILTPQLLKVRKNRRWGLAGFNGQIITENLYTEIESAYNYFIIANTEGQYLIWTFDDIFEFYTEKKQLSTQKYNKIEFLSPNFVKVITEEGTNIIDKKGNLLFQNFQPNVTFFEEAGFAINYGNKYKIYDLTGQKISSILFDKVLALPQRIAVKNGKKWGILMPNGRPYKDFVLDSVMIAGNLMVYWENKKILAEGKNHKIVEITGAKNMRFEKPFQDKNDWFLVYQENNNKKNILNSSCQKLLSGGNFQNYYFLSPHFLSVQQNGKFGLIDSTGKIIIPTKYDGVSLVKNSNKKIISQAGKFGLLENSVIIEPFFDEIPQKYEFNSQIIGYFGKKNNQLGLLDMKGKTLVPFEFQNLIIWNDSSALVQNKKNEWLFYFFYKAKDKTKKTEFKNVKVIAQNQESVFIVAQKYEAWGAWNGKKGMIVPHEFEQITNIGTTERPIFFAEKKAENKKRYQVMYYNREGKEIWSKVLNEENYLRLICE